jgi:putative ABC transport system substrate-binding protein
MKKAIWIALVAGLLSAFHLVARAEVANRVFVILSETSQPYQDVADTFSAALARKYQVQVAGLDALQSLELARMDSEGNLVVPVGVRAMRQWYGLHPVHASSLSLMVTRATVESLFGAENMAGRESAVYIDQPVYRSLSFIRMLLPTAEHVGLLLSEDGQVNLPAYRQDAARAKIGLSVETVNSPLEVPQALQRLLGRVDVLLMLPDAKVVNESTVRHILLTSYRKHIPVIGFSRGLTNAGAVAAVVTDLDAIGREGAVLARQWNPATGAIPPPRYASEFVLDFNRAVARSLGVQVPEDSQELLRWRKNLE